MPNVMAALPNIDCALCTTPQSLADAHYRVPCSDASKTRNRLKLAGVPQTRQSISAASGPKFTISWGRMQEILLFNNFFFELSIHALVAKIRPAKVVRRCPAGNTGRKKSPFWHDRTRLSGYVFGNKACIDNQKNSC